MTREELEKEADEYVTRTNNNDFTIEAYLAGAEPREKYIAELKAQIEKMKCCGNCRFSESDKLNGTFCHREGCFVVASAKCKLWEN